MENRRLWHEPPTSTIHMHDGTTIQAEVNGRYLDDIGYAFVDGRDITLRLADGEWYEYAEQSN